MKKYLCDGDCGQQTDNPQWEWEGRTDDGKFTVKMTVRRQDGDYADLCPECFEKIIHEATTAKVKAT